MEYGALLFLSLAIFCNLSYCEVIKTQKCYVPASQQRNCVVHQVNFDPCPEAAENKPCKVKIGANASISFEYTPTWGTSQAGSQAYKTGELLDVPFEQMDTNGCKYTTCPIEANKRQTYTFGMELSKQYPVGSVQAKVKLWNEEDYHQQCCIKLSVILVE